MEEANVTNELPPEVLSKIFEHCRPNLNELVNIVDVCQLARKAAIREYNRLGNDLVIRHPDDINNLVSLLCKPVSFTKLHIVWDVPSNAYSSSRVSQMCDVTEDVRNKQVKFSTNPFKYLTARLFRRTKPYAPSNVDCSSVSLDALTNASSLNHLQSFMFKVKNGDKGDYSSRVLAALLALILQTSTDTLTHLRLFNTGYDLSRKVVELLEACQHLSHLVLNGCRPYSEERRRLVNIIPTLSHLELLDLRGTYLHTSDNLSFIAAVKRGCTNISNNIMIGVLRVRPSDDVSVLQFVSYVGRLYIYELNTEQWRSLISSLSECVSQLSLGELEVTWCKNHITDDILLSLVQRLRGLKKVDADRCRELTNEGVVNVITASPQLEGINIRYIENINRDIIPLLDRVVTEKDVNIIAHYTKLSQQMWNNHGRKLYTGKNGNICLEYWPNIMMSGCQTLSATVL